MSAFSPEELAYMEAHRNDSRVQEIHWVYSVPIVCAVISTGLRLWAKRAGKNGITLDDYLIVLATICLVGECASGLGYGPPHGMGRHVITVSPYDQSMVRKGDYVFSHFYDIALVCVKLGILAFYHRVFAIPLFRKIVLGTAALVLGWGIGITVTLALACRPIEAFWDGNVKGVCLDLVTFTYFTNISNLITDVWIFLMPVPVIWHLQLQTKKKLLLSFIFSIGLATCIVSSIRLTVILGHGYPDFTWSYVPLGAYSAFEPLGGILCANIPIVWHMWRKRKPLFPGSSAFESHHSLTAIPGSSESRRGRIARSLGLSQADKSHNDSQVHTILDTDGGESAWSASEMRDAPSYPSRAQFFGKVERIQTRSSEAEDTCSESMESTSKRQSWSVALRHAPRSTMGLKKNVWEVRRK